MSPAEARIRVARGATHLDAIHPGWFGYVDTGVLTLSDPHRCVVGQLCGNYFNYSQLGLTRESAQELGFEYVPSPGWFYEHGVAFQTLQQIRENHQPLQDAWIAEIAGRSASAVQEVVST